MGFSATRPWRALTHDKTGVDFRSTALHPIRRYRSVHARKGRSTVGAGATAMLVDSGDGMGDEAVANDR